MAELQLLQPSSDLSRNRTVSLLDLAEIDLELGQQSASIARFDEVMQVRYDLFEAIGSPRERRDLAMALAARTRAAEWTSHWDAGVESGLKAERLLAVLLQEADSDERIRISYVHAITWLGLCQAGAGDAEAALGTLRHAVKLSGQAVDGASGMTSYRVYCARAQAAYGEVLVASGRLHEAIEHLSSAMEIVREGAAPGGGYISVPTVALMVEIRTNLGRALMHADPAQAADHLHAAARDQEKLKALGRERAVRAECRERLEHMLAEVGKAAQ